MGIANVVAILYFCSRMEENHLLELMQGHGVKPTANRIVIARALAAAGRPMSMTELETELETIDKSNIFRTLQAFREAHLVHVLDDSGDGVRYELCHSHHEGEDDDLHVHFYCEKCHRTYCLENVPVPQVSIPESFESRTVNYLIKGLCPACRD
jgi:Fur family ferric uptake transcriptional regulator